jgi:hypothetical protein
MVDRMWEVEHRSAAYVRPLALKGGPAYTINPQRAPGQVSYPHRTQPQPSAHRRGIHPIPNKPSREPRQSPINGPSQCNPFLCPGQRPRIPPQRSLCA